MARVKKPKFSIVERASEKFGKVFEVFNSKNVLLKTFVNEEFANRFINKELTEFAFNKALKTKPTGVSSDLKKEFGEELVTEL